MKNQSIKNILSIDSYESKQALRKVISNITGKPIEFTFDKETDKISVWHEVTGGEVSRFITDEYWAKIEDAAMWLNRCLSPNITINGLEKIIDGLKPYMIDEKYIKAHLLK